MIPPKMHSTSNLIPSDDHWSNSVSLLWSPDEKHLFLGHVQFFEDFLSFFSFFFLSNRVNLNLDIFRLMLGRYTAWIRWTIIFFSLGLVTAIAIVSSHGDLDVVLICILENTWSNGNRVENAMRLDSRAVWDALISNSVALKTWVERKIQRLKS